MSRSPVSYRDQAPTDGEVNKREQYGTFLSSVDRRHRREDDFAEKVAHAAFDQPMEDDMEMRVNNTRNGTTWKELAAIGAVFAFLGVATMSILVALGIWMWRMSEDQPSAPSSGPADSAYEVLFFDADGNPIRIPQRTDD